MLDRFEVRAEDGKRLTGRVTGLDLSQIPEEGVTQSELKARRVEYDLRFATDKPTSFITIMQRFTGAAGTNGLFDSSKRILVGEV